MELAIQGDEGVEVGRYRIIPRIPKEGDSVILIRKEYIPFFKNGVKLRFRRRPSSYGKEKELKWPKGKNTPVITGEYYHLELIGRKRITDIYAPIKIVPEEIRDNANLILEWVQGNRWFRAIKFMQYTHLKTIVRDVYFNNIETEVSDILDKLLVGDELEDKTAIAKSASELIKGLYGLRSVDKLFVGEKEPPLYLFRGFDCFNVSGHNRIPYMLYVEYLRTVSGSLVDGKVRYPGVRTFYSESEISQDYMFKYDWNFEKVKCKLINI